MSRTIRRVLVANRGEVARRVFRTCRPLGIATVAVYSDPDRLSPHVTEADVAVPLGGSSPTESYLDVEKLLAAARRTGADAVHPGFGFLAESAEFAAACLDAGLTWVGPRPAAIAAMASKVEAKAAMAGSGVPLLPGATLDGDDPNDWRRAAEAVGYPLLVKASAGGGGKGMREVADPAALADAVAAGRREAASAFGDPTVFLERRLVAPRHIEVQVVGDEHGTLVHLFERDCSLQRRHQKVVEEARAPALADGLRSRLYDAAVAAAKAIDYTNAGTVEFLVSGDELFFLEMNTRLQVEHPVTEEVTGLDVVRLQLEVAAGKPLGLDQSDVTVSGHAIEVRLYAEDPANDYLPSTGRIHRFRPGATPGIRWDVGVETGSEVSPHYDPMLGKVIAHAPTRRDAAARLARALRELHVHGVTTNRDTLVAVLESQPFLDGAVHTGFFDDHPEMLAVRPPEDVRRIHAVAATLGARQRRRSESALAPVAPAGWRNVDAGRAPDVFDAPEGAVHVACGPIGRTGDLAVDVDGRALPGRAVEVGDEIVDFELDGLRHRVSLNVAGSHHYVNGLGWQSDLVLRPRFPDAAASRAQQGPVSPVPGKIVLVEVALGQEVAPGDLLVVLEAMKVEHRIVAERRGIVTAIFVAAGDNVDAHQVLVELEAGGDD